MQWRRPVGISCKVRDRFVGQKSDRRRTHHDAGTKQDSGTTTNAVSKVGGEWQSDQRTNILDGVQQTQHGTPGVVEGVLPLGKRLETVHHASVETIGRGSDEQEGNPCVEDDDPGIRG